MELTKYAITITDQTPTDVADLIKEWREDDDAMGSAAFDLLNSIEPWLRTLPIYTTEVF